ncbi:hypothetical protein [Aliiroseovarius subalbicans]|uniref:hypothetical protein n=1 Tax=Aliiroseovarius subalbicans TaxID=2925840 RepID=UPI001F598DAC|nr:hypothetical protein [Aliiroseovarius subalbicans]MCI2401113.1 hypothetical protein [Aliiroseovarius subalbicans]
MTDTLAFAPTPCAPSFERTLNTLIKRHGRWRVLRALLAAPKPAEARRRARVVLAPTRHLARDLGLPPAEDPSMRLRDLHI